MNALTTLAAASILSLVPAAHAQLQIDWFTIDGGGGTSSGGSISITGTIGQHDTAASVGGAIACAGGFWPAFTPTGPACYPNCDGSTVAPTLTANDFLCFINAYAAANPYANCDGSSGSPILTANDFLCFLNAFANGCP